MNYNEYPKVLRHPQYKPAVIYRQPRYRPGEEGWGNPVDPGQTGKPAQFPEVMVNNMDQEQQYAAKGYVPAGKSDPEAYRRAMTNNDPKPESYFVEYPKCLYRAYKHGTKDDPYETAVVKNHAEETALGLGWFRTPGEALGWKPETKPETKEVGVSEAPKKTRGKSEEAKKAQSERMKKRWADKKAAEARV